MSYNAVVSPSFVIFWTLILLSAGLIARPIVHWVMEQAAQMLEKLEPEELPRPANQGDLQRLHK